MPAKKDKKNLTTYLSQEEYDKVKKAEDNDLIKKIVKGNDLAYKEIEKRYEKKLFIYLYHLVGNKEETEDILQNVFVKTYNNIESFDTKRKFSSWIYRIAHNEAVNYLKKKSKRKLVSWEDITTSKDKLITSADEKSPIEFWMKKETRKEVQDALDKLPRKYREVLVLRYFLDKTYADIADILKKPVNTVGTLVNRAKKKLLQVFKED